MKYAEYIVYNYLQFAQRRAYTHLIRRGRMKILGTDFIKAIFEYMKDLVLRVRISSIAEWPTHREW